MIYTYTCKRYQSFPCTFLFLTLILSKYVIRTLLLIALMPLELQIQLFECQAISGLQSNPSKTCVIFTATSSFRQAFSGKEMEGNSILPSLPAHRDFRYLYRARVYLLCRTFGSSITMISRDHRRRHPSTLSSS